MKYTPFAVHGRQWSAGWVDASLAGKSDCNPTTMQGKDYPLLVFCQQSDENKQKRCGVGFFRFNAFSQVLDSESVSGLRKKVNNGAHGH